MDKSKLAWPFNLAEYEVCCPKGHPVGLANGYTVFAPTWWKQRGRCNTCHRDVERMVGVRDKKFLAGPICWIGEMETKEQENWVHDTLEAHTCLRCRQLGARELAQTIRVVIAKDRRRKLDKVLDVLEKC